MNAALARDIPLAEKLIKQHIAHTSKVLLEEMEQGH
jgi:DNA-binding GntR family transcriptional regulator